MIYKVDNAKHGWPLIVVAQNQSTIIVYTLERYYDQYTPSQVVTEQQLLDASTEYSINLILEYQGQAYKIVGNKVISYNHNVVTAGQTIVIGMEHDHSVVYCLGPEKYPQIDVTDWRYMKYRTIRPILKIFVHTKNESLVDVDKVYYYDHNNDTIFITNDTLPETAVLDEQATYLPHLTVNTLENGDKQLLLQYQNTNSDILINGTIQLANQSGLLITSIPVSNGMAIISNQYIVGMPMADVLFGYNKVGEL